MKKSFNVEVESGELKIVNSNKAQVIIPKDKAQWIKDLIKNKSYSEIDKYVSTLPLMSDYAADGTLFPSSKDSADLYKNTLKIKDYYSKKNKYETIVSSNNYSGDDIHKENEIIRNNFFKKLKAGVPPYTNRRYESSVTTGISLLKGLTGIGTIKTDALDRDDKFKESDYYKKIDNNTYTQREMENNMLDMNAPETLYKKNIQPTKQVTYINKNDKKSILNGTNVMYGDIVTNYEYDPELIKPFNMLTPEERLKRFPLKNTKTIVKKPVQPYIVDEFKDEDFKKVLKNKTNNNRIGIDSKLTKTNKTVLYPEKKIPVKYVPKKEIQVETPKVEIPKKEQISLIDSSQIKFPGSFSREIMPQEKGYDATKSKTIRYDRKGRIIKN